jgi:hypothetical protein
MGKEINKMSDVELLRYIISKTIPKTHLSWVGSIAFKFSSGILSIIGVLACIGFPFFIFKAFSSKSNSDSDSWLFIAIASGVSGVVILWLTSIGYCLVNIREGIYQQIELQKSSINDTKKTGT